MVREANFIPQELARIASFSRYPEGDAPSALALARTGFVYSGREFKVSCPVCGLEIEKFRWDENPSEEHRKRSPDCPFAARDGALSSSSSPSIDVISEESVQSSPLMLDIYRSAVRRAGRQTQTVQSPQPAEASVQLSSVRVNREDPDYELLRWEQRRLDTFHDWPVAANAVPEDLARDGLFYTGTEDRVRCAFCRNGLRCWQPGDIPREEHRKYFPNCPFLQNRDVGNVRIERESNSLPSSSGQRSGTVDPSPSPPLPSPPCVTAGPNASVDLFMTSATARAVIEMGFSAKVVKQTVQQQLSETGEFFPNAEALLEKLLSLGVGISEVPSGVKSHEELEPGSSASVAQQRQPETTAFCAPSSEQAAVAHSVGQENVLTKRHKTRKKKRGKASNGEITVNMGSSANSNPSGTTSQANGITTSATSAAAGGASETASFPEAERFSDALLDAEEQELMEENARLREARLCRICMDKEVNTVFLPCGHLICCESCSPRVKDCPLCRTFIRGTVKTFLS